MCTIAELKSVGRIKGKDNVEKKTNVRIPFILQHPNLKFTKKN